LIAIVLFAVWLGLSLFQISFYRVAVVETLLLNSLIINVGAGGLYAFIGHAFFADRVARFIGWAKGNPFQFEVAVTYLALSALGFVSIWLRDKFWIAAIIAYSIFMLGAAYGHTREMIEKKNFSEGNAGPTFFIDIMNPLIMVVLGIIYCVEH
jgi:hypothetical protein